MWSPPRLWALDAGTGPPDSPGLRPRQLRVFCRRDSERCRRCCESRDFAGSPCAGQLGGRARASLGKIVASAARPLEEGGSAGTPVGCTGLRQYSVIDLAISTIEEHLADEDLSDLAASDQRRPGPARAPTGLASSATRAVAPGSRPSSTHRRGRNDVR